MGKITFDTSVKNVRCAANSQSKHVPTLSKAEDTAPNTRENASQNILSQKNAKFVKKEQDKELDFLNE